MPSGVWGRGKRTDHLRRKPRPRLYSTQAGPGMCLDAWKNSDEDIKERTFPEYRDGYSKRSPDMWRQQDRISPNCQMVKLRPWDVPSYITSSWLI